ncbi:hypothetical protein M2372_001718 [Chryseobacterium sp. BIGb0232]|nr:hypothetical protein [Chryseobacterium sp. BIGb0232]ROS18223.1 hypothetical protein EDF65_2615 [Chryseobacterium nakagawai]
MGIVSFASQVNGQFQKIKTKTYKDQTIPLNTKLNFKTYAKIK